MTTTTRLQQRLKELRPYVDEYQDVLTELQRRARDAYVREALRNAENGRECE